MVPSPSMGYCRSLSWSNKTPELINCNGGNTTRFEDKWNKRIRQNCPLITWYIYLGFRKTARKAKHTWFKHIEPIITNSLLSLYDCYHWKQNKKYLFQLFVSVTQIWKQCILNTRSFFCLLPMKPSISLLKK